MIKLQYGDRQWLKLLVLASLWSVSIWLIQEKAGIAHWTHLAWVIALSHSPALFVFISRPFLQRFFKDRMPFSTGIFPYVVGVLILGLSILPFFLRINDQQRLSHLKATQMFINWYESHSAYRFGACNEIEGKVNLTILQEDGRIDFMNFESFLSGKGPWSAPEIVQLFDKARIEENIESWPSAQSCEFWNIALHSKSTQEAREIRQFFRPKHFSNDTPDSEK